jgi:hypothetical protein
MKTILGRRAIGIKITFIDKTEVVPSCFATPFI